MKTNRLIWTATAGALGAALSLVAQEGPTSVQSGVYSEEQAERGEKSFGETCIVCHQPEEFADGGYMEGWSGQTVDDFVEFIRSTMPEDNPGRLKRSEYIDIVAYFFELNGLPAGDSPMERNHLTKLQIEGPYGESNEH